MAPYRTFYCGQIYQRPDNTAQSGRARGHASIVLIGSRGLVNWRNYAEAPPNFNLSLISGNTCD
ncbi:hypothetical protein EYF80_055001 [Liparis tanakae]|uniref:Uncharacterized protein n=1 Tax=Liparis tanakae TaxID=230148 RepID=A0A4Z2F1C9_9TELE|nr:hypothetical protein EYF80_055001 [Liparis tanakae]